MNPRLADGDPEVWSNVIQAANPATLLVAIGWRLDPHLKQNLSAEDIWQETLLKAWQRRAEFVWQDISAFRRWLLTIAERLIADHRDHLHAQKRDVARERRIEQEGTSSSGPQLEPWSSTTPSRVASARELAAAIERVLAELPDEFREVIRLRLIENLPVQEIADRLGLGESAVRHRFRRGSELYQQRLRALLESTTGRA